MPLHPKGGLGLPTAPIFGRLIQTAQQVGEIANSSRRPGERIRFPLAAIVAATLAVYVGLQSMSLTNALLLRNANLVASLTFDPMLIITNLMQGDHTLYQKFLVGMAGYIGATNAFVKGKEVVLHEVQQWWNELWADIKKDQLLRHLKKLAEISDPAVAKKAELAFHDAVKAGKDWSAIDFTGRSIERLLLLPSSLISLPSYNTKNLTVPKAWLQNNGYMKASANALRVGGEYISNKTPKSVKGVANVLVSVLGWDSQQQATKPEVYPEYDDVLKKVMSEKWVSPAPFDSAVTFFSSSARSLKQQRLDVDLIDAYTRDMTNYNMGRDLGVPVMSYYEPLLPSSNDWHKTAKENKYIKEMLEGVFPIANAQLYEKAKLYNEALYSLYTTGEYQPKVIPKYN